MSQSGAIMTPESIARLGRSFDEVCARPRALAGRFYEELFAAAPKLRPLFPADMTSLQGHFEAALALVIRNLENMTALQESLRELGVQHVHGARRPEDYRSFATRSYARSDPRRLVEQRAGGGLAPGDHGDRRPDAAGRRRSHRRCRGADGGYRVADPALAGPALPRTRD